MSKENKETKQVDFNAKDTKNDLIAKIKKANKVIAEQEAAASTPEKEELAKSIQVALESAQDAIDKGVFSPEITDSFNNLKTAIEEKQDRLKELYGVEEILAKMSAITVAHAELLREQEAEAKEKKKEIAENIKAAEKAAAKKKDDLYTEERDYIASLRKDREREEEEYQYNLKRKHQEDEDNWADKEKALQASWAATSEKAAEVLAEAHKEKEKVDTAMERIANIDEELAAKYDEGKKDGTKSAETSHLFETKALNAKHNAEMDLKKKEIEHLTEKNAELSSKNSALEDKLERAYGQIQELATASLTSASNNNSSNSDNGKK